LARHWEKMVFKIRLKITSKGKGKSGGARVISLVESAVIGMIEKTSEEITVNLLSIFDKSEIANLSDKELKELIKAFLKNRLSAFTSFKIFLKCSPCQALKSNAINC
jgi:hypothetical protein